MWRHWGRSYVDLSTNPELRDITRGQKSVGNYLDSRLSDGPNGAKASGFSGPMSACFPATTCLAATFDRQIPRRIVESLAEEAQSKGVRCLLAPTICIHRHPLGGRNFESYNEDPFVLGKLASEFIKGLQSKGMAATVKHYAANEQETRRMIVDRHDFVGTNFARNLPETI
ncbi:hypothetical protein FOXB_15784 [Fusarium oxysporum f. sp. conglutinans Fo5176]|uniref:beta-glucosidase n=1 Tax=Fusarium oxysporum (strain Fo5176) TaxID=660025 RepID=F9GAV2_FUSOF|nr:hypothetical protein FOXB_15784 [Fusarium oxysporum f. sp. conglutinans Fo5176]